MPLGRAVVPRCVEQVEEVLGVHGLGRALGRLVGHGVVPPDVAAVGPVDVAVGAVHHDAVLDRRRALHGDVGVGLEEGGGTLAVATVGGDEHLGLGVVDAIGQRVGREAAEDDAVGRAQPGAGQHGHGQLGDHRQVDGDPVAPLHPHALQRVGEAAHLVEQLGVGDGAGVARLALPVERDLVTPAGLDVAVEAVVRGVQRAAPEPAGEGQVPLEDRVEVGVPRQQLAGLAGPERLVVVGGLVVERSVRDQGLLGEVGGRGEDPVLGVVVLDRRVAHRSPPGCWADADVRGGAAVSPTRRRPPWRRPRSRPRSAGRR